MSYDFRRLSDGAQTWVGVTDAHALATSPGSAGAFSTANSTSALLGVSGVFTGPAEDISGYVEVRVTVLADVASATDGLKVEQSTDGVNWDVSDTFTVPAGVTKTFGFGAVQQFFRVVYTNGVTGQATFRLQSKFCYSRTKPSSIRSQDARSNENDFEEVVAYGAVYNGATWDRARGTVAGAYVQGAAAHSAAVVGNPVRIAGKVVTAVDTTLAVGETADLSMTTSGAAVVKAFSAPEADWTYAAASGGIVNTADNVLAVAAGAGIRNYLTGISIQNASATIATEVVIKDGSTVIWRGYLGIGSLLNSAVGLAFPTPLRSSANVALSVAAITTASTIYVNAQGYTAP